MGAFGESPVGTEGCIHEVHVLGRSHCGDSVEMRLLYAIIGIIGYVHATGLSLAGSDQHDACSRAGSIDRC